MTPIVIIKERSITNYFILSVVCLYSGPSTTSLTNLQIIKMQQLHIIILPWWDDKHPAASTSACRRTRRYMPASCTTTSPSWSRYHTLCDILKRRTLRLERKSRSAASLGAAASTLLCIQGRFLCTQNVHIGRASSRFLVLVRHYKRIYYMLPLFF